MPIVQYSKRAPRAESGLPELGRIRKGAPRQADQKQRPPDLDYFRFTPSDTLPTVSADELRDAWLSLYGEKPRVIRNAQFAADSIEAVFSDWMEEGGTSSKGMWVLNRRCDGQTIYFERDGNKVYREPVPCTHQCECKPVGKLNLFLPELCERIGALGIVTLVTGGTTDLDNIRNTLTMVRENLGGLRNFAFVLHRVEEQLMTPDGLPVKKWIVHLDLENAGAQRMARLAAQNALALPEGSTYPTAQLPALPARAERVPASTPEVQAPDDWEDAETEPERPEERLLGVAWHIVIKIGAKGRSYSLKLEHGASVSLYGFDAIRALSDEWSAQADLWKEYDAGQHAIKPLCVYSTGNGFVFAETDGTPPVSDDIAF